MNVDYKFAEIEMYFLFAEKRSNGLNCVPDTVNLANWLLERMRIMDCVKLRWCISLTTDTCMLYYAIMSICQFLSKLDNMVCTRLNDRFVVSADIVCNRDTDTINNIPFNL
jgi:hypothetical protein